MSYSRWSTSIWYTYWCVTDSNERDDQMFDVCAVASFSYKELTEDIDACLDHVRDLTKDCECKESDYLELKEYMEDFIEDVNGDPEYNTPSQRYKRGEIELDEAFVEEI